MTVSFQRTAHFPPDASCFVCQRRNLRDPRGKPPIVAHGIVHGNTWIDHFRKYVPLFRPKAETLLDYMHESCLKALVRAEGAVGRNCPGCRSLIDRTSVLSWKERVLEKTKKYTDHIEDLIPLAKLLIISNLVDSVFAGSLAGLIALVPGGWSIQIPCAIAINALANKRKIRISISNDFQLRKMLGINSYSAGLAPLGLNYSMGAIFGLAFSSYWHWRDGLPKELPIYMQLIGLASGVATVQFTGWYGALGIFVASNVLAVEFVANALKRQLEQEAQEQQNLQTAQEVAAEEPEPQNL